jgi:hypothetical protein
MACGSGHIEHGWATRIGTCGSVAAPTRLKLAFASPLTTREAHQVAKSVAKWTMDNITPTAFQNTGRKRKPERSE